MNISIFGDIDEIARATPVDGAQYIAVFGDARVDLSHVSMPESLRMSALAVFGDVKLVVPHGTEVVFKGFALFGDRKFNQARERSSEEVRSVIYLNGIAVFGDIEVVEV